MRPLPAICSLLYSPARIPIHRGTKAENMQSFRIGDRVRRGSRYCPSICETQKTGHRENALGNL